MILVKPSYQILTLDSLKVLKNIEAAGRTCYKSEDKITDDSASSFVRRIIKSGHESVIEHESFSVRFIVDRGVSHELVRHRLAAFSQESTRYCSYKGGVTFVIPPWVSLKEGHYDCMPDRSTLDLPTYTWLRSMKEAEIDYESLMNKCNWSPQQARSVLPNSLKTEVVMTANLREWRHVLKLRTSKAAHPQMQEIMIPLLMKLKVYLPEIFKDIVL